ncbi:hypothetical protein HHI36_020009 [Cryptolaemus montrouzieri]|uniref:Endonuclease/exonuclease/phosphatase domain-containing protein n=1 Tax=Cryptolaemus montrouzieri TaxID=559131 RepID=A0ABD2NA27_9CUCU
MNPGGVAILCRDGDQVGNVVVLSDISALSVEFHCEVTAVYLNKDKTVICGDFNVRSNVPDRDSGSLCDLLGNYGFRQTIFVPTRGPNCPDLKIVWSVQMYKKVTFLITEPSVLFLTSQKVHKS